MLVADYIIARLAEYTDYVFQIYGSASASLVDAFHRYDKPKLICMQHEQGATFAAEGYTKTTGNLGVVLVTSGPGAMNCVTGIGNAFYDSFPMLIITGQVNSKFMRPHDGIRQVGFQESPIVDIVKPITKYTKTVFRAEDIRYELEKAIHLAFEGRPGPVLLDLPLDVQKQEINPDKLIGYDPPKFEYTGVKDFCLKFLKDLLTAKRPVVLIGGGVKRSDIEILHKVIDRLGVPVYPTWNALDVVCSDYAFYGGRVGTYGGSGRNFGIQNCDLLLTIGCRVSGRITGGRVETFASAAKKYMVDIDQENLDKKFQQVPFDETLLCDVSHFLEVLYDCLGFLYIFADGSSAKLPSFAPWVAQCIEWRDKYDPVKQEFFNEPAEHVHPYAFMRILSEEMGPNDILCADCGGNIVVTNHAFQTKTGQTFITNNGNSPMSGSMCYAIGAKLAAPGKQVVCIIGDGGMMMNMQELQTMASYGIAVKVFILNNQIYGITKGFQKTNFESRHIACGGEKKEDYHPCNFWALAEVFNLYGMGIGGPKTKYVNYEYIRSEIKRILSLNESVICDVDCKDFCEYFPKIGNWHADISLQEPLLPKEEYLEQMYIEPVSDLEKIYGCSAQ
jgi:acetolactate synthase-1/2/3 large subunit